MNDLQNFSNYYNNLTSVYNEHENVLEKEFRNGEVQSKGFIFKFISKAHTFLLKSIDKITKSSLLQKAIEAQTTLLLKQNLDYHNRPGAVLPRRFHRINPEQMPLVKHISGQFSKKIGNNTPLAYLQKGINTWINQDIAFSKMTEEGKVALAALYGSGLLPDKLNEILREEPFTCTTPEDFATIAQVLNIYEKIKPAFDMQLPDDLQGTLEADGNGNLKIKPNLGLTQDKIAYLEKYIETKKLLPEETLRDIIYVKQLLYPPDKVLLDSAARRLYLADLKKEGISPEVPIDARGNPVPTQKQLELATKEAYRLFGEVPKFETDEAKAFFARTIQYFLVGEQLPYVPYPQDDCCFTYQEIQVKPEIVSNFRASNFTLGVIGTKDVATVLKQVMVDVSRGIPSLTIIFNKRPYAYPSDVSQLKALLVDIRTDFLLKGENPQFIESHRAMRKKLPVSDKAFHELIQRDLAKISGVDPEIKAQFAKLLTEFAQVSSNSELNEAWRVELLQLLIHLHQGLSAEILTPAGTLMLPEGYNNIEPQDHLVFFEHNSISVKGFANLVIDPRLIASESNRPNFEMHVPTEAGGAPSTIAVKVRNNFHVPLHTVNEGPQSQTFVWTHILISPHMVFHPEILQGLRQKAEPSPKTIASKMNELTTELDKIPRDKLKTMLQTGKPKTWDDLKTLMLCFKAREKGLPLLRLEEGNLRKYQSFITRDLDGKYRLNANFVPKVDGTLPQALYADVKATVELLNSLAPYEEKNQDIYDLLGSLRKPETFQELRWLHDQYVNQCRVNGIPWEVNQENNPNQLPSSAQLQIAHDLMRQQMRGFPEASSKISKAFLGRLMQLILYGPVLVDAIPHPDDEWITTSSLEKGQKVGTASPLGRYLTSLNGAKIQERISAFKNQNSEIRFEDQRFPLNRQLLGDLLPAYKSAFLKLINQGDNLPAALDHLDQLRAAWRLPKDDQAAFQQIQSWFWNSGLGDWASPFQNALQGEGRLSDLLWGVHLLEFVLLSQPQFAVDHLRPDVSRGLNSQAELDLTFPNRIIGIYEMDGLAWKGWFQMPLGSSRNAELPQVQLDLEASLKNLYAPNENIGMVLSNLQIAPYVKGDLDKLEAIVKVEP